ncbi:G-patch domain and KOW motifs-containing protein [Ascaphus truei]|uniref:G-patch domain and KOW motifs-containing protein n=1 Tax=Ascaphus truei TaxID=8439 RepID=UPI003F5A5619
MAAAGSSQAPISFGFSRSSRKILTGRRDTEAPEKDTREYLLGAEGRELLSVNPAPVSKPLVIPLINKNKWIRLDKAPEKAEDAEPQTEDEKVLSQAVKELIAESRRSQEDESELDETLRIPLLMQNRVPVGYEDGDKVDVALRPESAEAADYEAVPVEQYGMAMLRGMGWKQGEGIGRTFKQDVKPLEQKLRPKGLGLGADRTALKELEPQKRRRPLKPGEEPPEEERGLGTGSAVQIQSGTHKDLYGKVEGVDPDNARAMVRLAISDNVVTVSQFSLRLVSSAEYAKYAKDLSRVSKASQDPENAKEPHGEHSREGAQRRRGGEERREKSRNGETSGREKRQRPRSPTSERARRKRNETEAGKVKLLIGWLHRDLQVRFIDKRYKGGKYYNCKVLVEDVLSPGSCVCRTENGHMLEDIRQDMLETVIPKQEGECVMVVLGEHRGQVGKILHRDKEKSQALVHLQEQDAGVTLSYDVICRYTGEQED